jgi:hypothetical protein
LKSSRIFPVSDAEFLKWPFLIFTANSIALMVTALPNRLNAAVAGLLFDSPVVVFDGVVQVLARITLWGSSLAAFLSSAARCNAA